MEDLEQLYGLLNMTQMFLQKIIQVLLQTYIHTEYFRNSSFIWIQYNYNALQQWKYW